MQIPALPLRGNSQTFRLRGPTSRRYRTPLESTLEGQDLGAELVEGVLIWRKPNSVFCHQKDSRRFSVEMLTTRVVMIVKPAWTALFSFVKFLANFLILSFCVGGCIICPQPEAEACRKIFKKRFV